MTPATKCEIRDWYESVCTRIDVLAKAAQAECSEEDGDFVPNQKALEVAKNFLRELGQECAKIPTNRPTIWFGPGGVVGLTWRGKKENVSTKIEIIFNDSGIEQILKNSQAVEYSESTSANQLVLADVA